MANQFITPEMFTGHIIRTAEEVAARHGVPVERVLEYFVRSWQEAEALGILTAPHPDTSQTSPEESAQNSPSTAPPERQP
jgi:hypothetical protein